jgi:hypothetical protein
MWNDVGNVLDYLAMGLARAQPCKGWRFGSTEQLVLEYGQHFTPQSLPAGIRQGTPKQCYLNAFELSYVRRDLAYCEGFASSIAVAMHAWCVDRAGNVVDPTWTGRLAGREYFGIPFRTRWVVGVMARKTETGIIDNWEHDFPLLRRGIPNKALHRIHQPERPDVAAAIDRWRQAWEWLRQQSEATRNGDHVHERHETAAV